MNKKILGIGLTVLVLSALVFTVGGSVFAQDGTPEVQATELPAPVVTHYGRVLVRQWTVMELATRWYGVPDQLELRLRTARCRHAEWFRLRTWDWHMARNCDAYGEWYFLNSCALRDGSGTGMQYGPVQCRVVEFRVLSELWRHW